MKNITKVVVADTIRAMVANGENPTHASVKAKLGGGSATTITNGFKLYKSSVSEADSVEIVEVNSGDTKELFLKSVSSSLDKLLTSQTDEQKNLEDDLETANQLLEQTETKLAETSEKLLASLEEKKLLEQQIAMLEKSKLDEIESLTKSKNQEIDSLKAFFEEQKEQMKVDFAQQAEKLSGDFEQQKLTHLQQVDLLNEQLKNNIVNDTALKKDIEAKNAECERLAQEFGKLENKFEETVAKFENKLEESATKLEKLVAEKHEAEKQATQAIASLSAYKEKTTNNTPPSNTPLQSKGQ